jgi:hypothetical protein
MMLPFRRRPTTPKPSRKIPAVETSDSPPKTNGVSVHHLDYDLQPLRVESLSHYIDPVVDDERFRVH